MPLSPCKFCGKPPGTKVGPPAMARCITDGCEGRNLAAALESEWNSRQAPGPGFTITMGSSRSTMDLLAPGVPSIDITDPIPDAPVVQGPHGRAWLCDRAAGYRKLNVKPEEDAALDHWIVEAPWAHPAWHSYSILLLHLRDMPGQKHKTIFHIKDATHELHVLAMNPERDRRDLLATGIVDGHWLSPLNFAAQFIEITDELARERVRNTVQMICDGKLSPDTDHQRDWVRLYNHSMIKKEYR